MNLLPKLPSVTLRAMEPEDLDLLYQIENNMQLWNVGSTNVPYSRYVLHDYIAHASGDIYTDKQVRLIVDDDEHNAIGIVDIVNFSPQHKRAELGIVIQEKHRGKGYGKAVIKKTIDYALNVLHLHQLYAIVNCSQQYTIHLLKKMGFEQTCLLAQWLYDGKNYSNACLMQCFFTDDTKEQKEK